jgi:hypothetical protein
MHQAPVHNNPPKIRNKKFYLLGDMVEELSAGPGHDLMRYGVNLAVHHELLVARQLHEDDAKVRAAQVQRQELAVLRAVGQLAHVGGEALDAGVPVPLLAEPELDGVAHLLFHHVDVVVVQVQVPHAVLDEPGQQN